MTLSKKKKPAAASSVVSGEALGMDANIAMLVKERNANNAWHKLARNKTALVGFFIVAFMVVIAVFAPLIAYEDAAKVLSAARKEAAKKLDAAVISASVHEHSLNLPSTRIYGRSIRPLDNPLNEEPDSCCPLISQLRRWMPASASPIIGKSALIPIFCSIL